MNSRDAAYDDAIALSILGPGSAAMRARWEKTRQSDSADPEDDAAESMRQQVEATLDAVSELAAEGDTEGAANLLAGAPASTVAALGLPPRPEADEEDIQVEVQDEDRIQTPDADQGIPLAVDEPKEGACAHEMAVRTRLTRPQRRDLQRRRRPSPSTRTSTRTGPRTASPCRRAPVRHRQSVAVDESRVREPGRQETRSRGACRTTSRTWRICCPHRSRSPSR